MKMNENSHRALSLANQQSLLLTAPYASQHPPFSGLTNSRSGHAAFSTRKLVPPASRFLLRAQDFAGAQRRPIPARRPTACLISALASREDFSSGDRKTASPWKEAREQPPGTHCVPETVPMSFGPPDKPAGTTSWSWPSVGRYPARIRACGAACFIRVCNHLSWMAVSPSHSVTMPSSSASLRP